MDKSIYQNRYKTWLALADEKLCAELKAMDEREIEDAFYKELEFGTAGIRGIMGAGSNRLNIYTIRKISAGVATCLNKEKNIMDAATCLNGVSCLNKKTKEGKSVVISYDSRNNSREFAQTAAEVFASYGIRVRITGTLMPTPFLSFAVRQLKADAGIMITASHNPSSYNGYKVYDGRGCQLKDKTSRDMLGFIAEADGFKVKTKSFEEYLEKGAISYVPQELTEEYLKTVEGVVNCRAAGLKIVYTPLNGTGYILVPEILRRAGAEVMLTPLQDKPDGDFPTCPSPNPENKETLKLAIATAEAQNADLVIATDPDADRMALAFRRGDGFCSLTGNETGAIFAEYLLSRNGKENRGNEPTSVPDNYVNATAVTGNGKEGVMPTSVSGGKKHPVIIKSIVSTDLVTEIVKDHGAQITEVPTGFKYIGEEIAKLERSGRENDFLLGFEESCGYLGGTYVRDKDGIFASLLAAVIAAKLKAAGKTLGDKLEEIYGRYGKFVNKTISYRFEGAAGRAEAQRRIQALRDHPLKELCGEKVEKFTDYLALEEFGSDILDFRAGQLRLIIRPSGTEPLIKAYLTVSQKKNKTASCSEAVCSDYSSDELARKTDELAALSDKLFGARIPPHENGKTTPRE